MNYVDQNFKWLINQLEGKSEEELFFHMKEKYSQLSDSIKKSMEKFLSDFGYWGKLDFENEIYEEISNKANSFHDHLEDYKWLYEHLGDYRSKKLLFAILYNWYDYDFENLKSLMDQTYCHYFDLDLLSCSNEVFVDVGAYIGDSTLDFINSYGLDSYQKIYCYEMTSDIIPILKKNTESYPNILYRNYAVSDKCEILYMNENSESSSANTLSENGISVEATTLDEDIKDKITLLKMDIEGSEAQAILGARGHIENDHPKLLISVYHNHVDLWKIPKMIESILPGYTFYLRFYGSYIFPTEIVLFGIYKES